MPAGRLAAHGRLDVLVNNAGVCDDGPIEQQSLAELQRVIEVNLISVLDLCRLTAPLLLTTPHASVINVASMYGIVASRAPMAAYNATKGALINLTRQLAAQSGNRGVRVNALAPGFFPTDLTGHLADAALTQSIRSIWLTLRGGQRKGVARRGNFSAPVLSIPCREAAGECKDVLRTVLPEKRHHKGLARTVLP